MPSEHDLPGGTSVEKYTGDYSWDGEVCRCENCGHGTILTPDGKRRHVVAHPVKRGYVLHIYGPINLRRNDA